MLIQTLGYGVMVTLQILVLSFLVRVRVSQLLLKCFLFVESTFFGFLKTASSPSLSIKWGQRRLLFMFFKCIILRCFKFFHRFVNHQTIDSGEKNMLSNTLFAIGFSVDELSWASTNSYGKRIKYEGTS